MAHSLQEQNFENRLTLNSLREFGAPPPAIFKIYSLRSGQAVLASVIFLVLLSTVIVTGFTTPLARQLKSARAVLNSRQGYFAAESGVEDAAYRLKKNLAYTPSYNLTVGDAATAVTITESGSNRTINVTGDARNHIRKVATQVNLSNIGVDFFYGIQVDEGGLTMGNNARVNGNIYSNGDIVGSNGARITGSATVAIGAPATADQTWTTQNADYTVGADTGTVITTLDSTGNVGQYTSLALGADGFARISYYDVDNLDLKFIRCTNADCTTRVTTAVDSSGDQGWRYSSIALGADGFARISYYDNTVGDLKFIRCTNADCTTKNITAVETTNDIGQFSSLVLGADGFARISFYSVSGGDLKFVQCTNDDCTVKTITTVDSTGDVGKYTSLAIYPTDGFARISYIDEINDDLKFVQCTNVDCSTKNVTTVDSTPNINHNTALKLGSDGFARISYYDDGNDDLKFVQCADSSCSLKNITTLDSGGDVGRYSSIQLGSDQLARITYYDGNNGDFKYIQCTNAACTTKNTAVPDPNNVGQYTSLTLATDGFGRASYYTVGTKDLKYLRCVADPCAPPNNPQVDVGQSFKPSVSQRVVKTALYLKKVGLPANATVRLVTDSGGSPSTNALTTGTINASQVTGSYGWLTVSFISTPNLTANTTYWLIIDSAADSSNYLVWGGDSTDGYTNGTGKKSADWSSGGWSMIGGDLDFRLYVGGIDHQIKSVTVNGNVNAHITDTITVDGSVNTYTLTNSTVGGSVVANSIASCTIGGNASYNSKTSCIIGGIETTPTTPPADPPHIALPISDATISQWKTDAASGGVITGDYNISDDVSLGPKKITGDLNFAANSKTLTVTGVLWVVGDIDVSNLANIQCLASYGNNSCVIVADGWIHISNNGVFSGSGQPGSYVMLLSTLACDGSVGTAPGSQPCGHHNGTIDLHNNATGAIFYAANGLINLHNGVNVSEVTGYKINIENNAVVTYETGLANVNFTSGPGGAFQINRWKEVE